MNKNFSLERKKKSMYKVRVRRKNRDFLVSLSCSASMLVCQWGLGKPYSDVHQPYLDVAAHHSPILHGIIQHSLPNPLAL